MSELKAELKGIQEERKRVLKIVNKLENPYPKDIFSWENNEKLDFKRGRFHQHCFEIWENCKKDIKDLITGEGE